MRHKVILKLHHQSVGYVATLILILIVQILLYSAFRAHGAEDSAVAWHKMEDGESKFVLLHRNNNEWLETTHFFSDGPVNSPPVMVVDNNKRNFVVWTVRDNDSVRLAFRLIDGNRGTQLNFIKTPLRYAMAPHLAVDSSGVTWLTFSGSKGDDDDDIYVSSWSDGEWTPPQQLNTDDSLPDVLPLIGVGRAGEVWVRWQSFDGDRYNQYYSRWNGKKWSPEQINKMPDTIYESANARLKAANMKVNEGSSPDSVSYFYPEDEVQVWSSTHKQMYRKKW